MRSTYDLAIGSSFTAVLTHEEPNPLHNLRPFYVFIEDTPESGCTTHDGLYHEEYT